MRIAATRLALVALIAVGCGEADPIDGQPDAATSTPSVAASTAPDRVDGASQDDTQPAAPLASMPDLHPSVDGWPEAAVVVRDGPDDPGVLVRVRVATTVDQRAHGLMEVPELPDGAGMLFVYDTDRTGGFWMKGTLVPLDIAWVDQDGRVVAVATMTPCTGDPCPSWSPGAAYRLALEVPAGFLERHGLGVGSIVELRG